MSVPLLRGVVHGHTVVLAEDFDALPEGTEVVVTPLTPRRGSPEAVLAALSKYRPLSDEEADKMLRDIEEAFGQVDNEE